MLCNNPCKPYNTKCTIYRVNVITMLYFMRVIGISNVTYLWRVFAISIYRSLHLVSRAIVNNNQWSIGKLHCTKNFFKNMTALQCDRHTVYAQEINYSWVSLTYRTAVERAYIYTYIEHTYMQYCTVLHNFTELYLQFLLFYLALQGRKASL